MRVQLPVPDYTTMCRRKRGLDVRVGVAAAVHPRHIVIDTTGLKVFGAGEWNLRKHGMRRGRRRTWRKLHLGVDETTKEIVAMDLTTSRLHDCLQLPEILSGIPDAFTRREHLQHLNVGGAHPSAWGSSRTRAVDHQIHAVTHRPESPVHAVARAHTSDHWRTFTYAGSERTRGVSIKA